MKVIILYHPKSDHARTVESYAHDFSRQTGHELQLISLESKEGADMASMYDIVRYPSILVLNQNNELVKVWEGPVMPLMDELSYYLREQ